MPWKNQNQLRKGTKQRTYYRESKYNHRLFRWQMSSDEVISIALMAHHRGASIRGIRLTCKTVFGVTPCGGTVIRWKRKFAALVCHVCANTKSLGHILTCELRGTISPKTLEMKCQKFKPKLVSPEVLEKATKFFTSTQTWKPYSDVGHPGRRAKYDQKEWERRYANEYYRTHPEYAKTLVKNPDKLYSRLKLRLLTPEERKERKRKYQREWARRKYRKLKGGKINLEMSRRGRKGAEAKWGRKYSDEDT